MKRKYFLRYYKTSWKGKLTDPDQSRLQVYQTIKREFMQSKHLELPLFMRKVISKIRCSDHPLEIEKARHLNIPRTDRICKICTEGGIEDKEHFLLKCKIYQPLREKRFMYADNLYDFLNTETKENLAKYIIDAFKLREIRTEMSQL